MELYQGNYSVYEEQKRLKDAFEIGQNEKIKKEVSRLKKTAAEKAEWARSREGDKTKKVLDLLIQRTDESIVAQLVLMRLVR